MVQRSVSLRVNGAGQQVTADEATPLLYVLRNDLNLLGTRFGCGSGQCGACHVLVDGVSVPSCDTPLGTLQGKSVTTVEGLAAQGPDGVVLHPLQQAVVDEQAAQCGYCLSGILMTATELLRKHSDPSETEIRLALDKHLCRCGSHNRMVRAVLRAAHVKRDAPA
jgi:nicotinate dehydrogenase subunit A